MDSNNFVSADPNNPGKYVVYVNGQQQVDANGNSGWDQNFAQQVFNNASGGGSSNGGATSNGGGGGGSSSGSYAPGYNQGVQNAFQGTYGPNGQSGLTTYQIWLQQSVQNGTMSAQQAMSYGLPSSALSGAGGAGGGTSNGMVNTIDGPMSVQQMQQKLGTLGNPQVASTAYSITDPTALANYYNQVAQQAKDDAAAKAKEDALAAQAKQAGATTLIGNLLQSGILNGSYGPGGLSEINALLATLGLPQIAGGGADVNPLNMTPAQWDSLPPNVQNEILQAWQARGGDSKSFLAAIDRQRPGYGTGAAPATSGAQAGGNTVFAHPS